jgi:hypothetical protein
MKKTFDADKNYDKLVKYCDANGIRIGHVINSQIRNFLLEKKVLVESLDQ